MIKNNLENLKQTDLYSLVLFSLYKMIEIPEYSSLAELSYVLDRDNLLNFCEYFGGQTITVPTTRELEALTYSLLLYQYVNIDGMDLEESLKLIKNKTRDIKNIKNNYFNIASILENYNFNSGA
jgi:hypothetical protein